jgi:hypothetical protein
MLSLVIRNQARLTFRAATRWLSSLIHLCMRSCSFKVAHWEIVPVSLDLVLIVVQTRSVQLRLGLSFIFGRMSVSHLVISPSMVSVGMSFSLSHVSVAVMFTMLQFGGDKSLWVTCMNLLRESS